MTTVGGETVDAVKGRLKKRARGRMAAEVRGDGKDSRGFRDPMIASASRFVVSKSRWHGALDVVATLAMLTVAGAIVWRWLAVPVPTARPAVAVPTEPVSLKGLPLLGAQEARAAILVFSDFQCPYCARFASEIMPTLKEQYVDRGLARVGFRHLPLPIHGRAVRAAASAECAAEQGQFWAMHDELFRSPSKFEEPDLLGHATAIGLDKTKFEACMGRPASDRIREDMVMAQRIGFGGTPSFVVGRLEKGALQASSVIVGVRPIEVFRNALDGILDRR